MKKFVLWSILLFSVACEGTGSARAVDVADTTGGMTLYTRSRAESPKGSGQFDVMYKTAHWDPKKTAIIICDMWDRHWCKSATGRVAEMAPRTNAFVAEARKRGSLIVHSPSGCMAAYTNHPARKRAQVAPPTPLPDFLKRPPGPLAAEHRAKWPVDQSDGGCDCAPQCAQVVAYRRQIDTLKIADEDAISDSGIEIGNLFVQRGIENVIFLGVHTNMCVVGRPFGLRNLVRFGKNVVLVRDLTDAMYNSRKSPHVSHFRGTELVVEHIEKYICPTITSSDLLGGPAFRFQADRRPHVAFIVSDDHYHADKTLPAFAQMLGEQYNCYCSVAHGQHKADIPGLDELKAADVAVLFVRRLALPKVQLDKIRGYLNAGKPLVALRTANHAFSIQKALPPGTDQWPTFDREVLGGNYHSHTGKQAKVEWAPSAVGHPVFAGIDPTEWTSNGSLYLVSPIDKQAKLLQIGSVDGKKEPVTWTRSYKGGRVFFSSLGHWDDFAVPQFRDLLVHAIYWTMNRPVPSEH